MAIMDVVISFVTYFVAKYAAPALDDVKFVILGLQPVIMMLIYTYGNDSVARIRANALIKSAGKDDGGDDCASTPA